jgi:CheY-like chemotaxis protein
MHKLNTILLVDDDDATNYLHEIHLNNLNVAGNILKVHNGKQALDLLFSGKLLIPDLIILDINMPIINGWLFLEEYSKLRDSQISKIIMVTASINPLDETKGKTHPYVLDFIGKPLNEDKFMKILILMGK